MTEPALILLVEDSRMDIELTLDAFREARLANRVEVVRSGEAALEYMEGRGAYADRAAFPLPDLVLLDLKLPGISGFEVLETVKVSPRLKRIPIVILTSSREEGDRALGYDRGANSYLVKPVSFDGFLEVIRQVQDYWLTLNVRPPAAGGAR
jgi:CheY-like chemotaxis protein